MKPVLITFFAIIITSCKPNQNGSTNTIENSTDTETVADSFDWLSGKWKRLNEEAGKETYEYWKKVSDNEYAGTGFTIQHGDTIRQEQIQLILTSGRWNLEVIAPGEMEATIFTMIDSDETELICENRDIDFPNIIKYWKNGDRLKASVANSEMEITFEFERIKR